MAVSNKRVLIIDDDLDIRLLIKTTLARLDIEVLESSNVADGILLAGEQPPDLILVDLHMPGESGFDFLKKRKNSPKIAKTPVIVVSAMNDSDSVFKSISLGASDYLLKPISIHVLLQKVRKQLKDIDFKVHTFSEDTQQKVKFTTPVRFTKMGVSNFVIEIPARVAPNTRLNVRAPILLKLGIHECLFQTMTTPAVIGSNGMHFSRVNVIGLKEGLKAK